MEAKSLSTTAGPSPIRSSYATGQVRLTELPGVSLWCFFMGLIQGIDASLVKNK